MANEIMSYIEMCQREGTSLQRGMNYRIRGESSVILMSLRSNAPYNDRLENDGTTLSRSPTGWCAGRRIAASAYGRARASSA